jgi:hypothetical protein
LQVLCYRNPGELIHRQTGGLEETDRHGLPSQNLYFKARHGGSHPALRKLSQEDPEFEASLSFIARPHLRKRLYILTREA